MKHKLLLATASVAMLAAPSLAFAQDDPGVYIRGNIGYGIHTDADLEGDLFGDVESEGNGTASLGVGYDFGNNWRVELDGASLFTDMGQISQAPSSYAKLRTNTLMLNALYDFNDFGSFQPYVGAGLGLVQGKLSAQAHGILNPDLTINPSVVCNGGNACDFRDQDTAVGWQLLAGLGYAISDNLTWDTHYRYLNSGDMDFQGQRAVDAAQTGFTGADLDMDGIGAHSILTGFRYKFGAAAPKPAMVTCWNGDKVDSYSMCPEQPVVAPTMVTCWDGSEASSLAACPAQITYQTCWDGTQVTDLSQCPVQPQTVTCPDGTLVYDSIANCPSRDTSVTIGELCANEYRQEIIYYEFNKGQSAETRNTINRILDIGQYCQVGDIRVVGHTDSSGSAAYNLALSKRRAKDARDELVRQGVRSEIITSEGKGETELFVQTGDGVKEQLNRRTEVLIRLNQVGVIN